MKIDFTNEQLQILNEAIIELPFKIAAPLIKHINTEIQNNFNEKADYQDIPNGATNPKDNLAGD